MEEIVPMPEPEIEGARWADEQILEDAQAHEEQLILDAVARMREAARVRPELAPDLEALAGGLEVSV